MSGVEDRYSWDKVTEVCLLAGKIMMQNGGETYRVEDTMMRIAAAYGKDNSHSYVTPTGILFAIDGGAPGTRLIRINERSNDLRKVTLVNDVSRRISRGELTPAEACALLKDIDSKPPVYRPLLQVASATLASGCFLLMFNGTAADIVPSAIAGGAGFTALVLFQRYVPAKLFAELLAAVVVGALACLFVSIGIGHELDRIIIGAVMPLVPGLLLTNAVRDLMAGHLVSGLSKGAEAFLTAFAIGTGIAFVLSMYYS
ncbi:threonine/serine exporter family protein [Paenibacillus sp. PR3]|uniref:Threonine/serine exporter family protein n=1 Tax=Paenibacillus terricola TaxID=2763503 RepID=A0ABR8N076_9BACL|nr:threonine/serine exporter family protein [Paenibacillus terricola]MBD3920610.1 threonine/serine exporter family protein [Paenibacillus terricola]